LLSGVNYNINRAERSISGRLDIFEENKMLLPYVKLLLAFSKLFYKRAEPITGLHAMSVTTIQFEPKLEWGSQILMKPFNRYTIPK
jgi:hypothetical protein